MRLLLGLLVLSTCLAVPVAAHGDLTVHELETVAIRDFEGQEDSFPWEGFEIWDVYVGDGYNFQYDADGVYFKINFAGDGTQRPTGSAVWTVVIAFKVGEQAIERSITHDGVDVTTTFEALEWTIADGNVFQVKAWTPVPDGKGKAVHDIVVTSYVDDEIRDVAPGGIFLPAAGVEVPVQAPETPIYPPLGEGRIVEQVEVTGPAKFMDVTVTPQGNGTFEFVVKNPLSEQGQHVHMREPAASPAWKLESALFGSELNGGESKSFQVVLNMTAASGVVDPVVLDLYSDIGGRQLYYGYLDAGDIKLTDDVAEAKSATIEPVKASPASGLVGVLVGVGLMAVLRRRNGA